MPILNPNSVYQLTRPQRIDSKFIGIGQVYIQHKHKRKQIEKIYNDTQNTLFFAKKTQLELSQTLSEKQKELLRLQKVKQRFDNNKFQKIKREQQLQKKQFQLRKKVNYERKKLKSSIQQRISTLKQQRLQDKNFLKQRSRQLSEKHYQSEKNSLEMRKTMYITINMEKKKGMKAVDNFYKQRVLESLDQYNKKIKQQDQKTQFYQTRIQKMTHNISAISRNNQRKQKRLLKLDVKIEQLNPLKSFFSTKFSSSFNQSSFCRKSSLKSISSKKPTEILMEDFEIGNKLSIKQTTQINNKKKKLMRQNPESFRIIQQI